MLSAAHSEIKTENHIYCIWRISWIFGRIVQHSRSFLRCGAHPFGLSQNQKLDFARDWAIFYANCNVWNNAGIWKKSLFQWLNDIEFILFFKITFVDHFGDHSEICTYCIYGHHGLSRDRNTTNRIHNRIFGISNGNLNKKCFSDKYTYMKPNVSTNISMCEYSNIRKFHPDRFCQSVKLNNVVSQQE